MFNITLYDILWSYGLKSGQFDNFLSSVPNDCLVIDKNDYRPLNKVTNLSKLFAAKYGYLYKDKSGNVTVWTKKEFKAYCTSNKQEVATGRFKVREYKRQKKSQAAKQAAEVEKQRYLEEKETGRLFAIGKQAIKKRSKPHLPKPQPQAINVIVPKLCSNSISSN